MKALLDAIQRAIEASSVIGLFANGVEVSLAADAEALPVCVLTILPPPEGQYQSDGGTLAWVEEIQGQFSTYHTDPTFVQSMTGLLDGLFNRKPMTLDTPDRLLACWRAGGGNPYRDSDDARVWRSDLAYKFIVQHGNGATL